MLHLYEYLKMLIKKCRDKVPFELQTIALHCTSGCSWKKKYKPTKTAPEYWTAAIKQLSQNASFSLHNPLFLFPYHSLDFFNSLLHLSFDSFIFTFLLIGFV